MLEDENHSLSRGAVSASSLAAPRRRATRAGIAGGEAASAAQPWSSTPGRLEAANVHTHELAHKHATQQS
eukprot:4162965-Heterocapsa_arctica.AAC.1